MPDSAQEKYLAATAKALSPARLQLGFRLSAGETDVVVIARYIRNLALCEALYPVLHMLEIALRNRMDGVFGAAYPASTPKRGQLAYGELPCAGSWLDANPCVLAPRDQEEVRRVKSRIIDGEKKHLTADRLIAGLSMGFWTGLLTRKYEISPRSSFNLGDGKPTALWPRHLKPVFPYLTRRFATRDHVYRVLSELTTLRNQVFHHRPIWNLKLNALHVSATEAIGWMSPELQNTVLHFDRFPGVYNQGESEFKNKLQQILEEQAEAG